MQRLPAFETHTWCSDREMEDYIGTESCVDFQQHSTDDVVPSRRERMKEFPPARRERVKEFPPAISTPWVLKRYYTGDGRVIIREENVGRRECFTVRRAHGRLTLQLIPDVEEREDCCDDDDGVGCCSDLDGEEDCDEPDPDGGDDEDHVDVECEEDDTVDGCDVLPDGGISGGDRTVTVPVGGGGKCYNNYTSVMPRPCLLGMPVEPAIRTVHI